MSYYNMPLHINRMAAPSGDSSDEDVSANLSYNYVILNSYVHPIFKCIVCIRLYTCIALPLCELATCSLHGV